MTKQLCPNCATPTTGVFAFHNAYPETGDVSEDERTCEQADLDIDSDASNAELLERKPRNQRVKGQ